MENKVHKNLHENIQVRTAFELEYYQRIWLVSLIFDLVYCNQRASFHKDLQDPCIMEFLSPSTKNIL